MKNPLVIHSGKIPPRADRFCFVWPVTSADITGVPGTKHGCRTESELLAPEYRGDEYKNGHDLQTTHDHQ